MSERKRWEKQLEFHPLSRVNNATATTDAKADPVLTKQMQYIKVLEERNRVKKRLAAASKRNERLQEREEAFVTAFNVPVRATTAMPSRNTRSATTVLPTKVASKREEPKLAKCRSAPSTTLNFASGFTERDEDKELKHLRGKRAKWNRPRVPMHVAVDHQDGLPLFRLMTQYEEDERDGKDDVEEENYLEESFEEFEEEDERRDDQNAELASTEIQKDERQYDHDERDRLQDVAKDVPVDFSKTTKELFGIIQHLSRTKQRALVDVLQQFQASEQDESDVKTLQSSIGDPAIWKEITATLDPTPSSMIGSRAERLEDPEVPVVTPLKALLEDQLRWEDEYTNDVKERLARERQEKHRILKQAEERRAKMMKELEEEEKEIERLMVVKRQERLAKLRELQKDVLDVDSREAEVVSSKAIETKADFEDQSELMPVAKTEGPAQKWEKTRASDEMDPTLLIADAKGTQQALTQDARGSPSFPTPSLVPRLNLSVNSNERPLMSCEWHKIDVKLLSTWGRTRAVGLTGISVYDVNGEELAIDLDALQLYDQSSGRPFSKTNDMVRGLLKLFNGITQTNIEKDMWLGRLSDSGVLRIRLEVASIPSKLCVWNYNSKTHIACTRDVEVLVDNKSVWTGSLPETFGDPDDNICTWVDLLGTACKSSRTARSEETLKVSPRSDSIISTRWTEDLRSGERELFDGKNAGLEKTAPLWLASAPLTRRLSMTSRSSTGLETRMADEKPSTSHMLGRRRQGKPSYRVWNATNDVQDPDEADMKVSSSHAPARQNEEKLLYQHQASAPALSSLTSWDSLEKLSKVDRSSLTQPTNFSNPPSFGMDRTFERFEASPKPSSARTSFTTSALLTELRHGSCAATSGSLSPKILKNVSHFDRPDIKSNIGRDIVADIPVLPSGKWLKIEILSTWGDPHYVGLNGVEIFNHRGELVTFQDPLNQVTACPESINVLEENSDDPRVPKNLVDGVNFTCDDLHMWLAPYTPGDSHYVLLEMDSLVSVSMVRIWNYNKSRTHTCRGVRDARLILYDSTPANLKSEMNGTNSAFGKVVFQGEIRQAPGLVGADSMEISSEVILFTQEKALLAAIETNDEALRMIAREQQLEDEETREITASIHRSLEIQRPPTSDAGRAINEGSQEEPTLSHFDSGGQERPTTMASRPLARRDIKLRTSIDSWVVEEPQQEYPETATLGSDRTDEDLPRGQRLTLQLHSTWGDRNYIGLTQVDVLIGSHGTPLCLDAAKLDATPRDLASLGYVGDPRTLEKLIDGEATTCDDTHMWLVPFEVGAVPEVRLTLKTSQYFYGLRVWNYNKSPEDTYRGVKQLVVTLDGVLISPPGTGFLLRKAPGLADFDFGQLVNFSDRSKNSVHLSSYTKRVQYPFHTRAYKTPLVRQDYEAPLYPQGFLLKIVCWTTWGDPYYLGLNGIELYDFLGSKIVDKPAIISAVPYSVSELDPSVDRQQDARTPENLVSGLDKNTWQAHDAWLAPLASSLGNTRGNIVYIGFDTPVVLSMIKFWNYSKNPDRGVKDVDIYLDDLHLFSGMLKQAPMADPQGSSSRFGHVHRVIEQFGQPVLFSTSQAQVDAEKRSIYYCGVEEQDVLGINEGQVMQESRAMYRKPDPGAEGVVVDLDLRPMTAVCRQ